MKKYIILILCLISITFGINKIRPRPSSKGLVFSMSMYNFMGSVLLFDESLSGFVGTATGGTGTPVPKYPGFDFIAANTQYIDIRSGPTVTKTISLWIKQDDVAGNEYPISLNGIQHVSVLSGVVTVTIAGHSLYVDSVAGTSGVTTISAGVWTHIVVTDSTSNNAANFDIGRDDPNYYDGLISEVRLYNRVLTAIEVKNLYELQRFKYAT